MSRTTTGLLVLMAALPLSGCWVDADGGRRAPTPLETPWPDRDAPSDLMAVIDDLDAFRSVTGRLPFTLDELDKGHFSTGGPYARRAYRYAPEGLGILRGAWRILAIDDQRRAAGNLWCIVTAGVSVAGTSPYRLALIPDSELQRAAEDADRANAP